MTLEVSFAVLLAALLHASWNAMIKGGSDVLMDTAAIVVGAGVIALPCLFLVPLPAPASWPYIIASIITHLAYYFFMVSAYRSGDLSLVYPLMRGVAPLLTGVLAIVWMHEWPGTLGWAGMLLISLGVVALAFRPPRLGPALHGHGRAVGYALANAVVIAVYTIIDGSGARLSGNAWSYIVWLFALDALPFSVYLLVSRRGEFLSALAQRRQRPVARQRACRVDPVPVVHGTVGDPATAGAQRRRRHDSANVSVWASD